MVAYRNYAYIALLVLVLVLEKKISSFSISLMILALGENFSSFFTQPLLSLSQQPGIEYKFFWYGAWTLYSMAIVYFIYFFHALLKLRASKAAIIISIAMTLMAFLQVIDFAERATFDESSFAAVYKYGILFCNLIILPSITYVWFIDCHKERHLRLRYTN